MKKLFALSALIFLTGCNTPTTTPSSGGIQAQIQSTAPSGSGEICGGSSDKVCDRGFECLVSEEVSEDHGYCQPRQWDETLECDKSQQPLCGLRGTRKNGYQNECFAQKWGAEKVADGFCKKDETVAGSCEAQVLGLEGCFEVFEGYEFNGTECVSKRVFGCDVERPFETLEACQNSCQ